MQFVGKLLPYHSTDCTPVSRGTAQVARVAVARAASRDKGRLRHGAGHRHTDVRHPPSVTVADADRGTSLHFPLRDCQRTVRLRSWL